MSTLLLLLMVTGYRGVLHYVHKFRVPIVTRGVLYSHDPQFDWTVTRALRINRQIEATGLMR